MLRVAYRATCIYLLAGVFTCCICLLLLVLAQIVTLQRAYESAFEVFCAQRDLNIYLSTYVYIMHKYSDSVFVFFRSFVLRLFDTTIRGNIVKFVLVVFVLLYAREM